MLCALGAQNVYRYTKRIPGQPLGTLQKAILTNLGHPIPLSREPPSLHADPSDHPDSQLLGSPILETQFEDDPRQIEANARDAQGGDIGYWMDPEAYLQTNPDSPFWNPSPTNSMENSLAWDQEPPSPRR